MTEDLRRWRLSSVFVGPIFQIFPLTVNQRLQTITLLPSGLVYLLSVFFVKSPFIIYFDYFTFVYFWSERIDVFGKFLLRFTYNLLLWRSIVTCNRCNIVSSHKCLTYTNQTFCTMSFNRKLIKFFGWNISKLRGHVCFNFCVDVARILKLAPY